MVVGLHNEISDFSSPLLLLYTSHLLLFNLPIYQSTNCLQNLPTLSFPHFHRCKWMYGEALCICSLLQKHDWWISLWLLSRMGRTELWHQSVSPHAPLLSFPPSLTAYTIVALRVFLFGHLISCGALHTVYFVLGFTCCCMLGYWLYLTFCVDCTNISIFSALNKLI